MKLRKNAKESPKTTKRGIVGAIVTMLITVAVMFVAPKNPELAEIIKGSETAILAIGTSIASIIALIGANKQDK
jgi:CDP-diglyceride synthetase